MNACILREDTLLIRGSVVQSWAWSNVKGLRYPPHSENFFRQRVLLPILCVGLITLPSFAAGSALISPNLQAPTINSQSTLNPPPASHNGITPNNDLTSGTLTVPSDGRAIRCNQTHATARISIRWQRQQQRQHGAQVNTLTSVQAMWQNIRASRSSQPPSKKSRESPTPQMHEML